MRATRRRGVRKSDRMRSQDGRNSGKRDQRMGSARRPGTVTDALRQEAERGWAAADRKAERRRRRRDVKRRAASGEPSTPRGQREPTNSKPAQQRESGARKRRRQART